MRHLFLILLIALLPVRGWVGDAMATGMAGTPAQHQQQVATKMVAGHVHEVGAQGHFDHDAVVAQAGQAAADCTGHASGVASHAASTHCESCTACQACHTVALSQFASDLSPVVRGLTLSSIAADQFSSAEAALGQKPPIS